MAGGFGDTLVSLVFLAGRIELHFRAFILKIG